LPPSFTRFSLFKYPLFFLIGMVVSLPFFPTEWERGVLAWLVWIGEQGSALSRIGPGTWEVTGGSVSSPSPAALRGPGCPAWSEKQFLIDSFFSAPRAFWLKLTFFFLLAGALTNSISQADRTGCQGILRPSLTCKAILESGCVPFCRAVQGRVVLSSPAPQTSPFCERVLRAC